MDWYAGLGLGLAALLPGLFAMAWEAGRVSKDAERWNSATTPEEIQALLPPGHRYDPATGLCFPPEEGALPYYRLATFVR